MLRAMTRNPACLISCSHSLPEGNLSVLVGRHGAMNPGREGVLQHSGSCSNWSRFGATSTIMLVTPVTLPPGWFRLATRPSWMGSVPVSNTIGVVVVAAWAAALPAL